MQRTTFFPVFKAAHKRHKEKQRRYEAVLGAAEQNVLHRTIPNTFDEIVLLFNCGFHLWCLRTVRFFVLQLMSLRKQNWNDYCRTKIFLFRDSGLDDIHFRCLFIVCEPEMWIHNKRCIRKLAKDKADREWKSKIEVGNVGLAEESCKISSVKKT